MPVKISCKCGQSFTAKDELIGKTVKCPKCGNQLAIRAPQSPQQQAPQQARPPAAAPQPAPAAPRLDDLLAEIGISDYSGPRCPQCNSPVQAGAQICVDCGFH